MGVLTMEIEKMNKTIINNQKEVEKLARQLEIAKEEKKTQKEYERDLKKAVEHDCIECMKRDFEKEGFQNACINLQLVTTRQAILENVPESEIERQYLDDNYERIFNKVKKIYANNEKSKEQIQLLKNQQQLEEQQIQEQQDTKFENGIKIFFKILKWICIIIFAPIVFLFIFISMCAKGK